MSDNPLFTWRGAVCDCQALKATTKHVLLTIATHMNGRGEGSYPTVAQLMYETSLSKPAVLKHIKMAENLGWLAIKKHGFAGQRWRNNEYQPTVPSGHVRVTFKQSEAGKQELPPSNDEVVNESDHVSGEAGKPNDVKVVNLTSEGGKPNIKKVVNEVYPSSSYSSSDSSSVSTHTNAREPRHDWEKSKLTSPALETFLSIYPKPPKKKSRVRFAWWDNGCEAIADEIIAALKNQLATCSKYRNPRYVVIPEEYLDDQKWEDKIVEDKEPSQIKPQQESSVEFAKRIAKEREQRINQANQVIDV